MMTLMEPMLQREQYIKDLTAESARLRAALERLEWWSRRAGDVMQCPVCFHLQRDGKHARDCFIAEALQADAAQPAEPNEENNG